MPASVDIRIDKFLWAVRLYKTRSQASEECRKGRIAVNGIAVKPSRNISTGEVVTVKKLPVIYTYEVLQPIENRVSASLVENHIRDITPEEEKNKLVVARNTGFGIRPRGLGRPTKKDRRSLDRLSDSNIDF
ncbi:MAG: S4 domain-containing protein [Bacteroidales bacterium]